MSEDIVPEHTTNALSGHHENDLIIIYSKYEDLLAAHITPNPAMKGKYVPQWFMTDCVSDTRGVSIAPKTATVCENYREMATFGKESITSVTTGKVRKVLFYYSPSIIHVSGSRPF